MALNWLADLEDLFLQQILLDLIIMMMNFQRAIN